MAKKAFFMKRSIWPKIAKKGERRPEEERERTFHGTPIRLGGIWEKGERRKARTR
jgi:hypothetical protein